MKVVYVAGAYRAPTVAGIRRNIEAARTVAETIWRLGHCALCPHLNSALMDGIAPDAVFLAGGLLLLRRSDAVVLVPGWRKSTGTGQERKLAIELELPVLEYIDLLAGALDLLSASDTVRVRGRDMPINPKALGL